MGDEGFSRPNLLAERLAEWIREEIILGRMDPGQRLVEQALAQHLQVSRVPLREALRIVAADGLVTISAHRGATVAPLSDTELVELFDLRMALEGFAAAAAARRRTMIDLAPLRTYAADMMRAVADDDLDRYHALAAGFHSALVEAGGNKLLVETYNRVKTRFRRYQAAMARIPDLPARSIAEHDAILSAIEAGHADRARSLAERHISSLVERFAAQADAAQPATGLRAKTRVRRIST